MGNCVGGGKKKPSNHYPPRALIDQPPQHSNQPKENMQKQSNEFVKTPVQLHHPAEPKEEKDPSIKAEQPKRERRNTAQLQTSQNREEREQKQRAQREKVEKQRDQEEREIAKQSVIHEFKKYDTEEADYSILKKRKIQFGLQ